MTSARAMFWVAFWNRALRAHCAAALELEVADVSEYERLRIGERIQWLSGRHNEAVGRLHSIWETT